MNKIFIIEINNVSKDDYNTFIVIEIVINNIVIKLISVYYNGKAKCRL